MPSTPVPPSGAWKRAGARKRAVPRKRAGAWKWAVARYGDKRLFATRDILGEEDEIQPNGKLFRKLGFRQKYDQLHK